VGLFCWVKDPETSNIAFTKIIAKHFWVTNIAFWFFPCVASNDRHFTFSLRFGAGVPTVQTFFSHWDQFLQLFTDGQPRNTLGACFCSQPLSFPLRQFVSGTNTRLGLWAGKDLVTPMVGVYASITIGEV